MSDRVPIINRIAAVVPSKESYLALARALDDDDPSIDAAPRENLTSVYLIEEEDDERVLRNTGPGSLRRTFTRGTVIGKRGRVDKPIKYFASGLTCGWCTWCSTWPTAPSSTKTSDTRATGLPDTFSPESRPRSSWNGHS